MQHVERDAFAGVQNVRVQPSRQWALGLGAAILFRRYTYFCVIILLFAFGLIVSGPVDVDGVFSAEINQSLHPYLTQNVLLGIQYSIATLLIPAALIGFYLKTREELSRPYFWMSACPHCQCDKLERRHRRASQRFVAVLLWLPLFHFVCGNCDWQGSRIDHGLLT